MTGDRDGVRAQFDAWASTYDRHPWYRAQAEEVLRRLAPELEGRLLDVGCGTGRLLRRAVAERPGLRGVGVDLSPRMIETARRVAAEQGGHGRLTFRVADWESLDLAELGCGRGEDGFQAVVCVSAFHYFADPDAALRKMLGALVPGGRLLMLERQLEGSPLTGLWGLLHEHWLRDHVRFYGSSELLRRMAGAGFEAPALETRLRRWFWKGKLHTDLVLLSARAASPAPAAASAAGKTR